MNVDLKSLLTDAEMLDIIAFIESVPDRQQCLILKLIVELKAVKKEWEMMVQASDWKNRRN